LQSIVPVRVKQSQELISSDIHAGTADFKFTYSVEVLPICKVIFCSTLHEIHQ
jgi:nonsense-mediated mRNA decay protein 3